MLTIHNTEYQRPRPCSENLESADAEFPPIIPLVLEEHHSGLHLFFVTIYVGGVLIFFAVEAGWYFGRGSFKVAGSLFSFILVIAFVFCVQFFVLSKDIVDDFVKKRKDAREEMEMSGRAIVAGSN
jgi:glucan phosphoethanolaminetransferase (alkaline phosphatase superfamily)